MTTLDPLEMKLRGDAMATVMGKAIDYYVMYSTSDTPDWFEEGLETLKAWRELE